MFAVEQTEWNLTLAEKFSELLADLDGAMPPEFEFHPEPPAEWEPWHCVAVYKIRHVFMGTLHRKLWRGAVALAAGPEATLAMRGDPNAATPMANALSVPTQMQPKRSRSS